MMKLAICCAAGWQTKPLTESLRWAQSIRLFGPTADLYVGIAEQCPDYYREELQRLDVRLVPLSSAKDGQRSPDRLQLLLAPALAGYEFVVLSDCDIAVAGDFGSQLKAGCIRARLAKIAGSDAGGPGLVVFAGELREPFAARWQHWNRRVLEDPQPPGAVALPPDQAGLALALAESVEVIDELPVEMDFPCHLDASEYPQELRELEPVVLHYHDRVDGRTGWLLPTTLQGPDRVIARVNAGVSAQRRQRLCNSAFWDERYLRMPELGSGLGSRGEHNEFKARLVGEFLQRHAVKPLVDFGCGDCAMLEHLSPVSYRGVDGSREVIERNRARFPQHEFFCQQLDRCSVSAPLSLCFDVLIHQHSREAFDAVVDRILSLTAEAGLINGFDEDPRFDSDIVYFHQPLAVALADRGLKLHQVGSYRKTRIYEWSR
jgi:hypothetical protein